MDCRAIADDDARTWNFIFLPRMETKILHIHSDWVTLYAEQRGQSPLLIVMLDGTNDCEPYTRLCELLTGVTFDFFQTINQAYAARCNGFLPHEMSLYVGVCPADAFAPEVVDRINANNAYWMQYYFGVQDSHSYTKEELSRIPHADWTVGCWTPSWHTYGNIETAKRGGFSYTWLPSTHTSHLTCPELLAQQLKKTILKYQ